MGDLDKDLLFDVFLPNQFVSDSDSNLSSCDFDQLLGFYYSHGCNDCYRLFVGCVRSGTLQSKYSSVKD